MANIIQKFASYAIGEKNEVYERYHFYTRIQERGETIDAYVAALRTLIANCDFCDCSKEKLLRNRIVLGVTDERLRKRLLRERKLELKTCIDAEHQKQQDYTRK